MTILAEPVNPGITPGQPADGIAAVLRRAAHHVTHLGYERLVPGDVHHALRRAADGEYYLAQAALEALVTYLAIEGEDGWVLRWSEPRPCVAVAAMLEFAADAQPETPLVAVALRRAARYVDGPANESLLGALRQVCGDRDLLLHAVEVLASTLRRHVRDLRMWDATNPRKIVASGLRNAAAHAEAAVVAR